MNTLRYIHANPKAAAMQSGFFYDFSNYGVYDRLFCPHPKSLSQP